MYLSLPLPESRIRHVPLILVHIDGCAPPMQYSVEVHNSATIHDLLLALAKLAQLNVADGGARGAGAGPAGAAQEGGVRAQDVLCLAKVCAGGVCVQDTCCA